MTATAPWRTKTLVLFVAPLLTLAACVPLAVVHEVHPTLGGQHGGPSRLQTAEQAIADGQGLQRSEPTRALGLYLSAVQTSSIELRKNPADFHALRTYNFALARVFSVIRYAHLDPWTHSLDLPAPDGGKYVLSQCPPANRLWRPQDFDLMPADELDMRGKFVVSRVTREGAGAPLVAVQNHRAPSLAQWFVPPRIYLGVTANARCDGHRCEIEFCDPLAAETTKLAGRTFPAAADFTAPLALGLAREHPEKIGLAAMIDPQKFAYAERLIQVQPYDPRKIPVLFVHGLQSTPVSWVPMVNALWADPLLRRNYQVLVFSYPTGYPIPYSALLLRRELDALKRVHPGHPRMIVVGHSMGGILTRLMISGSGGERFWRELFGKSPDETPLAAEAKALLKEGLIFKPRGEVARVVFISTPHRGSVIAQDAIGRLASSIIRRPARFAGAGAEVLAGMIVQEDPTALKLKRLPNSIDTLAPNSPFVRIMNTLPLAKSVPYHSIIGDRGRGDSPRSSDGVVPYWSSHVDGAASEKIVPSGHGATTNPEAIAEVMRILKQPITDRDSARKRSRLHGAETRDESPFAHGRRNRTIATN